MPTQKPPPPPPPDTQQQPDRIGLIGGIAGIIKGFTLKNVAITALLALIILPGFVIWRVMNDASMLNKLTSRYEEYTSDKIPCTLRVASVRGGGDHYSISTGFAFQGSDRYIMGVIMDRKPGEIELQSYCEVLQKIVDHLRRPEDAPSPTFPGTDEPLIWHYPPEESSSSSP
jgi:hypothetical protein